MFVCKDLACAGKFAAAAELRKAAKLAGRLAELFVETHSGVRIVGRYIIPNVGAILRRSI